MTAPTGVGPVVDTADERADQRHGRPVDVESLAELARRVLARELAGVSGNGDRGVPPIGSSVAQISLVFVDPDEIRRLNREHRGIDRVTDVLSFSIDPDPPVGASGAVPPWLLGDIVICPAMAARNAPVHAGTYEDELALLVVHGVLHLLGMDHVGDVDAEEMEARERLHLGGER